MYSFNLIMSEEKLNTVFQFLAFDLQLFLGTFYTSHTI